MSRSVLSCGFLHLTCNVDLFIAAEFSLQGILQVNGDADINSTRVFKYLSGSCGSGASKSSGV